MGVFRVQVQFGQGERVKAYLVSFEVETCDSVAALAEALVARGVVAGHKLATVDDGRGGRLVRRRMPFALGLAGIVAIDDHLPVWEPAE